MNQSYEQYKPSGIDWLDAIPSHWEVKKLKHIASIFGRIGYRGYTVDDIVAENEGVVTISPSNIKNDVFTLENSTYISYDKYYESPEIMIFPNDIVLVKTGSTIGKTAIIPAGMPEMTINPQLIVLKQIQLDPKYLYYQTVCEYFKLSFLVEQTGSTTPTISQEKINNFPIIFTSLAEQRAIAAYLDRKTAQIDQLVAQKEQLLNLLQKKRQAIINETVTRGLDTNAPRKDSGIEWLGEIPAHWEVKKLKYVASLKSGDTITSETIEDEGEYPVYGGGGFRGYTSAYTHEGHYALIGRQGALCGNINYAKGKFWASEHALVVAHLGEYETIWLGELLRAMNLNQYSQSSAQPGISAERIQNLHIPVPPFKEQSAIVKFILTKGEKISQAVTDIKTQLAHLKTYRQSLISEVVTGKIDVRAKATADV
ncbi:hypothetical protein GCM10027341_27170 [Spirosoma knui]